MKTKYEIKVSNAVKNCYKLIGRKAPKVIIKYDIHEALILAAQLRAGKTKVSRKAVAKQVDLMELPAIYLDEIFTPVTKKGRKIFNNIKDLIKHCRGMWTFDDVAIVLATKEYRRILAGKVNKVTDAEFNELLNISRPQDY